MRTTALLILTLAGLLSCGAGTRGLDTDTPRDNVSASGLALDGYDPVSYFAEEREPVKGAEATSAEHAGATYRFATDENRAKFLAAPERFVPAYGGWCAWAMVDGERVEVDPKSFLIQDGELLLFYDGFLADTRKKWRNGDSGQLKVQADEAWMEFTRARAPQPGQ